MTLAFASRTAADLSTLASGKSAVSADLYGISRILMGEALDRIEAARYEEERSDCLLESAAVLIGELRAGLDLQHGGVFAANVDDLYDYICRRLQVAASGNADGTLANAALGEVWHLLEALRSAWTFMPAEVRAASGN